MDINQTLELEHLIETFPDTKYIPSRSLHTSRGKYNIVPQGNLLYSHEERCYEAYKDEANNTWWRIPWYLNIFHKPWKYTKFTNLDRDRIEGGLGSSEVQMDSEGKIINEGSYNFRDFQLCGQWRHFLADILPAILYCS